MNVVYLKRPLELKGNLSDIIAGAERGEVVIDTNFFPRTTANGDLWDAYARALAGSLDAAAELHSEMLPGWDWSIVRGNARVCDAEAEFCTFASNPVASRAWLIAILKACEASQ